MPRRPKGTGDKSSADKNTFNPPQGGGEQAMNTKPAVSQADQFDQDPKRRIGQHSGAGKPPLMKK
jgi:hypothetical protein